MTGRARLTRLAGDRGPGAVELLGTAPERERLQRMDAETSRVRSERCERCGAADVRDPRPWFDRGGDLGDRRVRHAHQHELRVCLTDSEPAFTQPRTDGGAGAARADDVDSVQHLSSSSVTDAGHLGVYPLLRCQAPVFRPSGRLANRSGLAPGVQSSSCRSTSTSAWSASRISRSSYAAKSRSHAPTARQRTCRGSSRPSRCTGSRSSRASPAAVAVAAAAARAAAATRP